MSTLWDFSDTAMTFDQSNYYFDGSVVEPITPGLSMPNLIGEQYLEALEVLQQTGILNIQKLGYFGEYPVSVTWVESTQAAGTVISQSPAVGASINVNQALTLTVSQFPISVAFP